MFLSLVQVSVFLFQSRTQGLKSILLKIQKYVCQKIKLKKIKYKLFRKQTERIQRVIHKCIYIKHSKGNFRLNGSDNGFCNLNLKLK